MCTEAAGLTCCQAGVQGCAKMCHRKQPPLSPLCAFSPATMGMLPYWPRNATLSYNLLALAAFWSWTAFVLGIVGGSTGKWADVLYYSPRDGVSFTRGLWRECTWAQFPGHHQCTRITPRNAFMWERTVQGLFIIWILLQCMVAIMFTTAMPAAMCLRNTMSERGERCANGKAKAAGSLSLFTAFVGLVVMSVFVARTPDGGKGVGSSNHSRHLTWSFGLWTPAWCLDVAMAPIGWAA